MRSQTLELSLTERMIQDGRGQGRVFNTSEGFVGSVGSYHPRSLVLESQRDIKGNQRLVLGDEDNPSFERGFHATPCWPLSAISRA
jgi:hypothetical protein